MDLTAQARQFSGRKFGELVLHHSKKQSLAQIVAALQGTVEELPHAARPSVEGWIDQMNPSALDCEFWARDCGDVFLDICLRARQVLKATLPKPTDEQVFSMFQIIVLNFAYAIQQDSKSKSFVQKSIGVGFIGRLLG